MREREIKRERNRVKLVDLYLNPIDLLQEVRTVKLADKSGSVNLSLWNEPGKVLMSGDRWG